jgi:hypothetical protein
MLAKMRVTTWILFQDSASDEDWSRYNRWITRQAETRRSFNGLVAIAEREIFDNSHLFTLAFDTFMTDNFLTYVVKSIKYKIRLTEASVAFFSSFFFTKLYREGHEDPTLRNKYSYEGVARWTQKMVLS